MLKKVLIGLAVVIVLVIGIAFLMPKEIVVERSTVINEPVEKVFEQLNSFPNWVAWSPWQKLDPEMKHTYSGPESGVGHKDAWVSDNKEVGKGSQTIVTSVPGELIESKLEFDGQGEAKGFFKFEEVEGGTKVTWGMNMDAGMNPMMRYMGTMMDGMMGPVFEQGLADMKTHVEDLPDPVTEMPENEGAESDSTGTEMPQDMPEVEAES